VEAEDVRSRDNAKGLPKNSLKLTIHRSTKNCGPIQDIKNNQTLHD
jgi:hypothetical protein